MGEYLLCDCWRVIGTECTSDSKLRAAQTVDGNTPLELNTAAKLRWADTSLDSD